MCHLINLGLCSVLRNPRQKGGKLYSFPYITRGFSSSKAKGEFRTPVLRVSLFDANSDDGMLFTTLFGLPSVARWSRPIHTEEHIEKVLY